MFHAARFATEKAVFRPALPTCPMPGISEMQMTKLTYAEQLKHPNWQRKRLEALNAAEFECTNCGNKEKTLHVHHKKYVRGRSAWEYDLHELQVLCEDCHEATHEVKGKLAEVLGRKFNDIPMDEFAYGLLVGFLGPFHLASADEMESAWRVSQPSVDLGYMLAALGPADLKDAVRRKIAEGRLPATGYMKYVLED